MVFGVRGNDARRAERVHRICRKRHRCAMGLRGFTGRLGTFVVVVASCAARARPPRDPTNAARYYDLLLLRPPRALRPAAGQNTFAFVAGMLAQVQPHRGGAVAAVPSRCRHVVVLSRCQR